MQPQVPQIAPVLPAGPAAAQQAELLAGAVPLAAAGLVSQHAAASMLQQEPLAPFCPPFQAVAAAGAALMQQHAGAAIPQLQALQMAPVLPAGLAAGQQQAGAAAAQLQVGAVQLAAMGLAPQLAAAGVLQQEPPVPFSLPLPVALPLAGTGVAQPQAASVGALQQRPPMPPLDLHRLISERSPDTPHPLQLPPALRGHGQAIAQAAAAAALPQGMNPAAAVLCNPFSAAFYGLPLVQSPRSLALLQQTTSQLARVATMAAGVARAAADSSACLQ